MINDIKLDNIVTVATQKKAHPQETQAKAPSVPVSDDITVSTGLSKHINSLMAENSVTDEHSRVMEMKNRIESDNYIVDTDSLAKKIFQDVFAKNTG
jgi:anti-sigma28 factor (negative regulator of flagellin synthesis)